MKKVTCIKKKEKCDGEAPPFGASGATGNVGNMMVSVAIHTSSRYYIDVSPFSTQAFLKMTP